MSREAIRAAIEEVIDPKRPRQGIVRPPDVDEITDAVMAVLPVEHSELVEDVQEGPDIWEELRRRLPPEFFADETPVQFVSVGTTEVDGEPTELYALRPYAHDAVTGEEVSVPPEYEKGLADADSSHSEQPS